MAKGGKLKNINFSSKLSSFKAYVCYFLIFLKDECISLLVQTKYIEKKFNLQLFFLPTVPQTFILS